MRAVALGGVVGSECGDSIRGEVGGARQFERLAVVFDGHLRAIVVEVGVDRLDARVAVGVGEGWVLEVEAAVDHTDRDTLAGESLREWLRGVEDVVDP